MLNFVLSWMLMLYPQNILIGPSITTGPTLRSATAAIAGISLTQVTGACSGAATLSAGKACSISTAALTVAGSFSTLPTSGHTIVAFCGGVSGADVFTIADNQGNNFSMVTAANGATGNISLYVGYLVVGSTSGTYTVTCTESVGNDFLSMAILDYAGAGATPLDLGSTTPGGTSTTWTPGSITTGNVNEMVVSGCSSDASGSPITYTPQNSFVTEVSQSDGNTFGIIVVQDRLVTAATGYTGSTIASASGDYKCGVIALK